MGVAGLSCIVDRHCQVVSAVRQICTIFHGCFTCETGTLLPAAADAAGACQPAAALPSRATLECCRSAQLAAAYLAPDSARTCQPL